MGFRERHAREQRSHLLSAAERLGREHGWSDLSVEDITRAAGMAKGSFYTYFRSKQALRAALEVRKFSDVSEQIPSIALSSDPVGGTEGYMTHLVDLATSSGVEGVRRFLSLITQSNDARGADAFFSYRKLVTVFMEDRALRRKTPAGDITLFLDELTVGILAAWAADPQRDRDDHSPERLAGKAGQPLRRVLKPWVRGKGKPSNKAES